MLYEIKISWNNHISREDSEIYETKFTHINAAKRKLLELALNDDNLLEENATLYIDDNIMYAKCEGRRDTSEYSIQKVKLDISHDNPKKISANELSQMIVDVKSDYPTVKIHINKNKA